ncbi:aminotransferase class III-fold pyridoxal phosphate-dependent enzyme [Bacillus sp. X1(2014)]|uniref:aminotransferase class III-fold pyridoxal phosphate-dependent enzyme n=1 Tax=Bacillus sp. X1(2014) TaxID=1565991 RepID=UPI0011A9D575|nr:aminotransferase class III-fold pyridoxal phosphate-dependent enzyme [Bacillus sp. X1(2014)]
MKNHFNIVGDIRGIGLFYGVELVRDRNSKEKAISEAERVMYKCMEKGLSFKVSQGNVLTLAPPLMDIVAQSIKEIIAQV